MPKIYNLVKQEDGKYTVQKVDVFRLGECKGYTFDSAWAESAIRHMSRLKEEGYLPPVIAGHNSYWGELDEKQAMGFMDNFSVEEGSIPGSGVIYCDIVDINESDVSIIKDMKFPYRSVEVHPEEQYFCALALLGGTEPYHKLPRLQVNDKVVGFAGDDKKKQVFSFSVTDDGLKFNKKVPDVVRFMNAIKNFFVESSEPDADEASTEQYYGAERRIKPVEVITYERRKSEYRYNGNQPIGSDSPDAGEFQRQPRGTGGNMPKITMTEEQREQFKQTYGEYPDELKARADKYASDAKEFRLSAEKNAAEKFQADLKAENVSPAATALIEEIIKYGLDDKRSELQAKLIELVKCAKGGSFVVPANEADAPVVGAGGLSDEEQFNNSIIELQKKNPKLSFQEAYEQVRAARRK